MKMSEDGKIHLLEFLLFLSLFLESSGFARHSGASESFLDNTSSCARSCIARDELRNLTLDNIKQDILSKLGMDSPPVIPDSVKARVPPLDQLLNSHRTRFQFIDGMQGDQPATDAVGSSFTVGEIPPDATDDFFIKTDRILGLSTSSTTAPAGVSHLPIRQFDFADSPQKDNVKSANLWIYIKGVPRNSSAGAGDLSSGPTININVYKVTSSGSNLRSYLSVTGEGPEEPGTWITFDVTDIVSEWYAKPRRNMGLYITATDAQGNDYYVIDAPQKGSFIEVFTSEKPQRRAKREVIGLNCEESSRENRCCRHPLEVNFQDFGWDWIIAPKKYEAYFCAGECPYVFLQKYAYTHVLTQMSEKPKAAGPCCAPRKMGSISMLYFNSEYTIVLGELPEMVVESCGCF